MWLGGQEEGRGVMNNWTEVETKSQQHTKIGEWKCERRSVGTTARPGTTVTQEGPSGWNGREGIQSAITSPPHAHSVYKATLFPLQEIEVRSPPRLHHNPYLTREKNENYVLTGLGSSAPNTFCLP